MISLVAQYCNDQLTGPVCQDVHARVNDTAILVGVMLSPHKAQFPCFASCDSHNFRAAPHTKTCPDFSLIFSIDANRVVRSRGPLIASLGARLVSTHAGVNHYPLSMRGKLVTQNVAVTVARLIVR